MVLWQLNSELSARSARASRGAFRFGAPAQTLGVCVPYCALRSQPSRLTPQGSSLIPQASSLKRLVRRDIAADSPPNERNVISSRDLRATSPATKPRRRDMAGRIRSAACGVPSATTARDSMRRFRYPARHACAANHAARGDLSGAHQSGRAPGGAHRGWDPSRLFLVRACPPNGVARTSFMQKTERREQ